MCESEATTHISGIGIDRSFFPLTFTELLFYCWPRQSARHLGQNSWHMVQDGHQSFAQQSIGFSKGIEVPNPIKVLPTDKAFLRGCIFMGGFSMLWLDSILLRRFFVDQKHHEGIDVVDHTKFVAAMERDGSKAQWMMKIALIGWYIMVHSMGPLLRSPINCKVSIFYQSYIMNHESCLHVLQTQRKQCHRQNSIRVGLISFSAVFGMIFPRKINCSFPSEFVSIELSPSPWGCVIWWDSLLQVSSPWPNGWQHL